MSANAIRYLSAIMILIVAASSPPPARAQEQARLMEVVVTGAGLNPDSAKQNAFSNAIEQVVGVLVDAETLVKNNQIVRDRVLTFTRGDIQEYRVIDSWQKDGLHFARIRARVVVGKLAERLTAQKIAVREVPGDLLVRQVKFDLRNEKDAKEVFAKLMAGFRMEQLVKVEIVGKPEMVSKDDSHAKLRVTVKLSPDLVKWNALANDLRPFLVKVSTQRSAIKCQADGFRQQRLVSPPAKELKARIAGEGVLVSLLQSMNPLGDRTEWDIYRVPQALQGVLEDSAKQKYRLAYEFLTADGLVVAKAQQELIKSVMGRKYQVEPMDYRDMMADGLAHKAGIRTWWVSPLLWWYREYRAVMDFDTEVQISHDDLRKVVRVTACIERIAP